MFIAAEFQVLVVKSGNVSNIFLQVLLVFYGFCQFCIAFFYVRVIHENAKRFFRAEFLIRMEMSIIHSQTNYSKHFRILLELKYSLLFKGLFIFVIKEKEEKERERENKFTISQKEIEKVRDFHYHLFSMQKM